MRLGNPVVADVQNRPYPPRQPYEFDAAIRGAGVRHDHKEGRDGIVDYRGTGTPAISSHMRIAWPIIVGMEPDETCWRGKCANEDVMNDDCTETTSSHLS